ncbi:MAG: XrtA/PEP-CTERM system histidine kinase PrsK [Casimicrobiaceae bacterium]
MSPSTADIIGWSYGIAAVLYAGYALRHASSRRRRDARDWAMLAGLALTAAWALAVLGYALLDAPIWLVASATADALRSGAWFAFLLALMGRSVTERPVSEGRDRALTIVAALIVAWGVAAQALVVTDNFTFGYPGRLAAYGTLAAAVFTLILVEQIFRNTSETSRWGITPLCLGLAGAAAFDIYLFSDALLFNRLDLDIWSVRGFVYALALPLIALSVSRHGGKPMRVVVSRRMMFRSLALIGAGLYLLFMAAAGYYVRYFGGEWGRALQAALLFAGALLLLLILFSGSTRARVRVLISKHFFKYRYDYRDEWLNFTKALSTGEDQLAMGQQVVRGLANLVESPAGGLWLRDSAGKSFVPSARWNMPASLGEEPIDGELARFLKQSGWVVNLEEFRYSPDRYADLQLPQWLSQIANAWLIVPLTSGADVIGYVVLVTARTPIDVNWEVNDLLKTAGRQAASFLGQMQATEALIESRKFEAFNRMSAFVVHDLKNIVSQLSLMVRNAERHRDNPEFQRDMLMTVEHSVERMKQLMMQLREGATPIEAPRRVEMDDVIRRIAQSKVGQQPALEVEIAERVAAQGHEDRLERVIAHLVQNAIDATGSDGRVWIKLARQADQALIEIGDTGHGMTPEFVRERLFKPFQTTKQAGMGIGAYESHQYVQELGGRVLVETTPGAGTCMRLLLPLFKTSPGAAPDSQRAVA